MRRTKRILQNFIPSYLPKDAQDLRDYLVIDIETTGISPERNYVITLGLITFDEDPVLSQYFAENIHEEMELLRILSEEVRRRRVFLFYNGRRFQIPFIRKRASLYGTDDIFAGVSILLDYQPLLKQFADAIGLTGTSQLEVEAAMGTGRPDSTDGRDLAIAYQSFLETKSPDAMGVILRHNEADLLGILRLLPLLSLRDLLICPPVIKKLQANQYKGFKGAEISELEDLIFYSKLPFKLPFRITKLYKHMAFSAEQDRCIVKVPLFTGELKLFYENYKDYYYFPEQDTAIHKSIASFTEKEHRQKCTPANCYARFSGTYVPQWDFDKLHAFRREKGEKKSYLALDSAFTSDSERLSLYVLHIINQIFEIQ